MVSLMDQTWGTTSTETVLHTYNMLLPLADLFTAEWQGERLLCWRAAFGGWLS